MDADAKKTALRMIPYGLYVLTAESGDQFAHHCRNLRLTAQVRKNQVSHCYPLRLVKRSPLADLHPPTAMD